MYSDLNLYYLNQIGITPWITKENNYSVLNNTQAKKQLSHKLVVLTKSHYGTKAKILVKRILAFINLDQHELLILQVEDNASEIRGDQLNNISPLAILALGLKAEDIVTEVNLNCPMVSSVDLDYVIDNPFEKKKIFKDLSYINELILRG